jgi:hypothetical protein
LHPLQEAVEERLAIEDGEHATERVMRRCFFSELSQFFLNKKSGSGWVKGGGKEEGISYADG